MTTMALQLSAYSHVWTKLGQKINIEYTRISIIHILYVKRTYIYSSQSRNPITVHECFYLFTFLMIKREKISCLSFPSKKVNKLGC